MPVAVFHKLQGNVPTSAANKHTQPSVAHHSLVNQQHHHGRDCFFVYSHSSILHCPKDVQEKGASTVVVRYLAGHGRLGGRQIQSDGASRRSRLGLSSARRRILWEAATKVRDSTTATSGSEQATTATQWDCWLWGSSAAKPGRTKRRTCHHRLRRVLVVSQRKLDTQHRRIHVLRLAVGSERGRAPHWKRIIFLARNTAWTHHQRMRKNVNAESRRDHRRNCYFPLIS